MSAAKAAEATFVARVRWRCEADPRWEIETRHGPFPMPEDAALFANGFSTRSPVLLELHAGRLNLGFTDGSSQRIRTADVQVWRLPRDFDVTQPADDSSFDHVRASLRDLTDLGLDGRWGQLAYGVVGPAGETIDVLLEMDETGDLKVITIDEGPAVEEEGPALFSLGVMPRA